MKKLLLLSAAFFFLMNANFATIRTVSNSPLGGAQYTTVVAAYNAASNGDTLLVEGTNVNYIEPFADCSGTSGWNKSLTVIGMGFNAQKQNFRPTLFFGRSGCSDADFIISSGAGGSKFYGIVFVSNVKFVQSISNITFEDCRFTGSLNYNNQAASACIARNCIFDVDNASNVILGSANSVSLFENCLFDGYIEGNNNSITTTNINHCLFLRQNADPLQNLKAATVSNCIFMNFSSVANSATTDGTFLNNLARLATNLPPTGNSGSGNLTTSNPNFVNFTLGALYSTTQDYALQAGSPAIGAGSDLTDIGIHGGTSYFSETGEVLITPIVRALQINNTSVTSGGTLSVQVQAGKPNND